MSELWRPSEHEPLAGDEWSEEGAEAAIAAIVADTEAAYDGTRWPAVSADVEPFYSEVYFGGAGIIWALHELGSTGWADASLSFLDHIRVQPAAVEYETPMSYTFGELGVALVAFLLTGDSGVGDRVHELVLADLELETNEVMNGRPGKLLAAEAMLAWTGEQRWSAVWDALADDVLAARDEDGMWTQQLGRPDRILGVAHGFAGNARALANRRSFEVDSVLAAHVRRDGPLVNWPPAEGDSPEKMRVQWCHGAPGIVAALGDFMDEDLAVAGGELTWRAGPLAKGSGLCHGTAGNAYAFLVLHQRTGDDVWLDRARAFGMHAIAQVAREREQLGRGRYSLLAGDIGVALFLRHLLDGKSDFPTLRPFN
ncbi:MAG: hypothetical protein QOG85_1927 [Gaiellaceae bacterium]|nr:hypothetical protein [Gaiellaceae bacterium]